MSSRMRLSVAATAALGVLSAGMAHAAVQCPPTSGGHPLRTVGGGTLFQGPILDNATLAPDSTQQGPTGWVNTWHFRDASGITLVCRYQGSQTPEVFALTRDVTGCRQDAHSFVCK